jgi:peptidoglycan LD-endopeptidase LytH
MKRAPKAARTTRSTSWPPAKRQSSRRSQGKSSGFTSERGGLTVYQLGPDDKTVYYYAHLSRYADDLAQGQTVAPGKLIGYVGDTGNAGPNNCHLHFAMWAVSDPKKFWSGEDINPYPLLSQAR